MVEKNVQMEKVIAKMEKVAREQNMIRLAQLYNRVVEQEGFIESGLDRLGKIVSQDENGVPDFPKGSREAAKYMVSDTLARYVLGYEQEQQAGYTQHNGGTYVEGESTTASDYDLLRMEQMRDVVDSLDGRDVRMMKGLESAEVAEYISDKAASRTKPYTIDLDVIVGDNINKGVVEGQNNDAHIKKLDELKAQGHVSDLSEKDLKDGNFNTTAPGSMQYVVGDNPEEGRATHKVVVHASSPKEAIEALKTSGQLTEDQAKQFEETLKSEGFKGQLNSGELTDLMPAEDKSKALETATQNPELEDVPVEKRASEIARKEPTKTTDFKDYDGSHGKPPVLQSLKDFADMVKGVKDSKNEPKKEASKDDAEDSKNPTLLDRAKAVTMIPRTLAGNGLQTVGAILAGGGKIIQGAGKGDVIEGLKEGGKEIKSAQESMTKDMADEFKNVKDIVVHDAKQIGKGVEKFASGVSSADPMPDAPQSDTVSGYKEQIESKDELIQSYEEQLEEMTRKNEEANSRIQELEEQGFNQDGTVDRDKDESENEQEVGE